MRQTFKLGTIWGIPVGMHWSVLVIMVLIADILARAVLPATAPGTPGAVRWAVAAVAAIVFLGSLGAHEFAHAVVARRHGVRVGSITLWMLGGLAELSDEPPDATADLRIAGVGPLTSAVAAGLFAGIGAAIGALGAPPIATASLNWLAVTNALIAGFNLLPGAPLDGGRILRAVLWRRGGDRASAGRAASRAGMLLGRAMIVGGLAVALLVSFFNGLWFALIGWFIAASARAEERWTTVRDAAAGLRAADIMTPHPDHGWSWQPATTFVEDVAIRSRQTVFPVLDVSGAPVAAVTADRLAAGAPHRDVDVTLGNLGVPLDADHVVTPDLPAIKLLQRRPVAGDLLAVVFDGHQLLGIVTASDVERMLRRNRLGSPTAA